MKIRLYPLLLGITLAGGLPALLAGCDRQDTIPPSATVTPTTTVGTDIDDTVVTTKVTSAMLSDPDVKGTDIKVETRKGIVQLSGFVDTQDQASRAMVVARAVEGAKGVENGMTIRGGPLSVGNKIDDSIVTTKVKSALLADASVKSFDIAAATNKGVVQLSGFVNNQGQIDRALELTRGVEGVQSVVSEMSIKK